MAIVQPQGIPVPNGFAIKHRSESIFCLSDLFFKKKQKILNELLIKEPLQVQRRLVCTNLVGPFGWYNESKFIFSELSKLLTSLHFTVNILASLNGNYNSFFQF